MYRIQIEKLTEKAPPEDTGYQRYDRQTIYEQTVEDLDVSGLVTKINALREDVNL